MEITDVHAHIFPQKIAEKAVSSISEFYANTRMTHTGTAEALLDSGTRAGVSRYVVFSTATTPEQVQSINSFIISECKKHREFIGLGTLHPDFLGVEDELQRLLDSDIHGVKLHPDFQKFYFDDEKMLSVYAAIADRNMFVLTHSGDNRYDYSHPGRIRHVAEQVPKLKIIAAHFGGWMQWEAAECLNLEQLYFDTSSTIPFGGVECAKHLLEYLNPEHFFFGTDFPMWDHVEELERIKSLGLNQSTLEGILTKNFERFYSQFKK